jgi:hypothetical protein
MTKVMALLAVSLMMTVPAPSQHQGGDQAKPPKGNHAVGGGHIPAHGPLGARGRPPVRTLAPQAGDPAHLNYSDERGHPNAPHVHANDRWVGHDSGPTDPLLHLGRVSNTGRRRPARRHNAW